MRVGGSGARRGRVMEEWPTLMGVGGVFRLGRRAARSRNLGQGGDDQGRLVIGQAQRIGQFRAVCERLHQQLSIHPVSLFHKSNIQPRPQRSCVAKTRLLALRSHLRGVCGSNCVALPRMIGVFLSSSHSVDPSLAPACAANPSSRMVPRGTEKHGIQGAKACGIWVSRDALSRAVHEVEEPCRRFNRVKFQAHRTGSYPFPRPCEAWRDLLADNPSKSKTEEETSEGERMEVEGEKELTDEMKDALREVVIAFSPPSSTVLGAAHSTKQARTRGEEDRRSGAELQRIDRARRIRNAQRPKLDYNVLKDMTRSGELRSFCNEGLLERVLGRACGWGGVWFGSTALSAGAARGSGDLSVRETATAAVVSCICGWRRCCDAVGAEESDREFTAERGRECCENLGHCGGVFATHLAEVGNPGQSCSCHSKIEPTAEKGNNIKKNFSVGGVQQKATVG
ncbi:hypothetical protein B0H14DRAFT_2618940 [Mycena olivaceomarginata]|nr:hypothetical protein B0H14DRAFT_2618940 [Mycena olivaceomarginata]